MRSGAGEFDPAAFDFQPCKTGAVDHGGDAPAFEVFEAGQRFGGFVEVEHLRVVEEYAAAGGVVVAPRELLDVDRVAAPYREIDDVVAGTVLQHRDRFDFSRSVVYCPAS